MADPVSAADSWSAIAAIVGGGGISGITIAVIGYLTAQRSGRRGEPEKAAGFAGISALLADSTSITSLVISIDRLALAADKFALLSEETKADFLGKFEDYIDEVRKLRRAVEDVKGN